SSPVSSSNPLAATPARRPVGVLNANLAVALAVTYAGPREHDDRPDGDVLARDEPGERRETAESRKPELSGVGVSEASDAPAGA
ncbi:hypothetical protein ACWD95_26910, partial [Streptomyces sp. NPDC005069]